MGPRQSQPPGEQLALPLTRSSRGVRGDGEKRGCAGGRAPGTEPPARSERRARPGQVPSAGATSAAQRGREQPAHRDRSRAPGEGRAGCGSGARQEAQPPPEGENGLERRRRGACPPPAAAYHPQRQPGGRRPRPAPQRRVRPRTVRSGPVPSTAPPRSGRCQLPFPEGPADLPAPACPGVHGLSQADSRALEVESLTDPENGAEAWDVFFKSVWGMPATVPESPMCRSGCSTGGASGSAVLGAGKWMFHLAQNTP
ncbi:PREDICTED: basic proline-rich protein-like [Ficedula albicollis]|uniref:basic proline-rich protein-like n=1 Tax=Ficedula albicollis TaxID=59894 RepID=UPI0007AD7C04|nr:PREDICTED: basic proline-rich protein-like [Ficedula albicollis]